MKNTEIIENLKAHYSRDTRKQLIESMQHDEKDNKIPNYKTINQIFSYVLSELNWDMAESAQKWDASPLDIMEESFPHIGKTKWFKEQLLVTKKDIDVEMRG
jgi:hypothetical protein